MMRWGWQERGQHGQYISLPPSPPPLSSSPFASPSFLLSSFTDLPNSMLTVLAFSLIDLFLSSFSFIPFSDPLSFLSPTSFLSSSLFPFSHSLSLSLSLSFLLTFSLSLSLSFLLHHLSVPLSFLSPTSFLCPSLFFFSPTSFLCPSLPHPPPFYQNAIVSLYC